MSMTSGPVPPVAESGTRGRTRRAIIDAAASVLARDRRATLAEIAKAADVGRSTLHRYFPDRDQLVLTAARDSLEMIDQAVRDAAVEQGPPLDAMRRLTTALVDTGDRLLFAVGDLQLFEEISAATEGEDETERLVVDLIERGQREGVFDTGVSAAWIMQALWALVYAGAEAAQQGTLPRHGVTAHVVRTLEGGILAGGITAGGIPAGRGEETREA
ncbi:TetR/AcrR family transcriptional regulator [Streptomyces sp. NPDC088387]|uniref:TetR/AcrR family transcriptional regulator n=1 Tax=Streptomyces sp. NPDC088387 TaxID=3365859 RepID=UPI0037FE9E99